MVFFFSKKEKQKCQERWRLNKTFKFTFVLFNFLPAQTVCNKPSNPCLQRMVFKNTFSCSCHGNKNAIWGWDEILTKSKFIFVKFTVLGRDTIKFTHVWFMATIKEHPVRMKLFHNKLTFCCTHVPHSKGNKLFLISANAFFGGRGGGTTTKKFVGR